MAKPSERLAKARRLGVAAVIATLVVTACSGEGSGSDRPSGGTGGGGAGTGGAGTGAAGSGAADAGGGLGGSTGGSGGSYWDTPQWAACLEVVRGVCERTTTCAPAEAAWRYGDSDQVNRCIAAERESYCFGASQPHQSPDALTWLSCAAAAAPKLDCAEAFFLPFFAFWASCGPYPNGTQPVGGTCANHSECNTRFCDLSNKYQNQGCGQCAATVAVGGDCNGDPECTDGSRCILGKCVAELAENAPCGQGVPCGAGLTCKEVSSTESQCRKYAHLGDACDVSLKHQCAPYFEPVPTAGISSGVACEAGLCTWKPGAPFKRAVGEVCNDVTTVDICGQKSGAPDARCDKTSGKCVATVGEGEDCDGARPCDQGKGGAFCIQGKCVLTPPNIPDCYK
ncbi:MAG: hypothetical protein R3B13_07910 [Polyangiaceae bacterium]